LSLGASVRMTPAATSSLRRAASRALRIPHADAGVPNSYIEAMYTGTWHAACSGHVACKSQRLQLPRLHIHGAIPASCGRVCATEANERAGAAHDVITMPCRMIAVFCARHKRHFLRGNRHAAGCASSCTLPSTSISVGCPGGG
jgi:hypothetical protein